MTQFSFPWPNAEPDVGDGRLISDAEFAFFVTCLFQQASPNSQGIIKLPTGAVYGNLEVSSPAANTLRVTSGCGVCDGRFYISTATEDLTTTAPVGSSRKDVVLLRASWSGDKQYTVRLAIKTGSSVSYPTMDRTHNVLWELPLYGYTINTSGVVSAIERVADYCKSSLMVDSDHIDADMAGGDDLLTHVNATTAHGAVSAATASKLVVRDASGRAAFADPSASGDAATKGYTDTTLATHRNAATLDHADDSVTAAKLAHSIDASGIGFKAADSDMLDGLHVGDIATGGIFVGAIMMWAGTLGGTDGHRPMVSGSPNEDWHICNGDLVGSVQTPDLRDRFPVGAGSTYNVGTTGGKASNNFSHRHAGTDLAVATSSNHTHVISSSGSHSHTTGVQTVQSGSGVNLTIPVASGGAHTHSPGNAGAHTHTLSGNTAYAGDSVDLRPPFYGVFFIMKVK